MQRRAICFPVQCSDWRVTDWSSPALLQKMKCAKNQLRLLRGFCNEAARCHLPARWRVKKQTFEGSVRADEQIAA